MKQKNPLAISEINPLILNVVNETDFSDWDKEQYIAAGEDISKIKYFSQWILGKLASMYAKNYGDMPVYARQIHVELNSLYAYKSVYETITKAKPDYIPDGYLTWGALLMIAKSEDPKKAIEMIEKMSEDGKITMKEIQRTIKEEERRVKGDNRKLPRKPVVKLTVNEELNKWEMEMSLEDMDNVNWQGKWGKLFYEYLNKIWKK